ncbi:SCO1664 family protein [Demetria terragena]|uniref:SCO1664 family protein n=1 Tax=Demetria terragena TaxID=63959 RepID=UPI000365632B|nr:SCO1664 family protein [Demetria terragena]
MLDTLETGEIEVEGRLLDASNVALRVWVGESRVRAIYKPVRGERPLWDFPDGTLAGRELATYLIARAGGWPHVPETVLREGPLGPGSVQRWVGPLDGVESDLIRVDPVADQPEGYLPVVGVELEDGTPMVVSHADDARLAGLAVLDLVLNNTDRKASHLIEDDHQLWAIDHGVTLHAEPKVRTVLWGWAADPLPTRETERLSRLLAALADGLGDALGDLLTEEEVAALRLRARKLLDGGVFPVPTGDRYPLPWPLW